MAYWLMSSWIARAAASFRTSGAGKLGKPWARLIERYSRARRVIPRITDSRNPWVRRAVLKRGLRWCGFAGEDYTPGLGTAGPIVALDSLHDLSPRPAASNCRLAQPPRPRR